MDFDNKMVGPKAKQDSKFEQVFVAGTWITRCRKTRRQVIIVGNKVTYVPHAKSIQT